MSKSDPTLPGMPWHITRIIMDGTDVLSRPAIRRCSRTLRRYSDEVNAEFERISIQFSNKYITLVLQTKTGSQSITYQYSVSDHNIGTLIMADDYIERLAFDLIAIVARPSVTVKELHIWKLGAGYIGELVRDREELIAKRTYTEEQFETDEAVFLKAMKKMLGEKKINLKKLDVALTEHKVEHVVKMLSFFTPAVLEDMNFELLKEPKNSKELFELDQWKQASKVSFDHRSLKVPIKKLLHFKNLMIIRRKISLKEAKILIEGATRHGKNLGKYRFAVWGNDQEVCDYVKELNGVVNIPDEGVTLEVLTHRSEFIIRKKIID